VCDKSNIVAACRLVKRRAFRLCQALGVSGVTRARNETIERAFVGCATIGPGLSVCRRRCVAGLSSQGPCRDFGLTRPCVLRHAAGA